MKLFPVFLAVALACAGVAHAETCATPEIVKRDVASFPFRTVVTEMTPEQSQRLLSALNSIPPATNVTADFVIAVSSPDRPTMILALFRNGCVERTLFLDRAVFLRAMGVAA